MPKTDDVVLRALVAFERHTRLHTSGGMLDLWRLAKAAPAEYRRRDRDKSDAIIEDGERALEEYVRTGDREAKRRMTLGRNEQSRRVYEAALRRGGIEP